MTGKVLPKPLWPLNFSKSLPFAGLPKLAAEKSAVKGYPSATRFLMRLTRCVRSFLCSGFLPLIPGSVASGERWPHASQHFHAAKVRDGCCNCAPLRSRRCAARHNRDVRDILALIDRPRWRVTT